MIHKYILREKALFCLFLASIAIIIIRIVFSRTPELYKFGAEVGNVLSTLSLGYIISYIFYYLVVFLKSQKDKKNVGEFIVSKLSIIIINAYRVFFGLKINAKTPNLTFPPNEEELSKMFKKLDPVDSICQRTNKRKYNWYEYFKVVIVEESIQYIEQVWKLFPYLDTELIRILNSLKDSYMFSAAIGISREIIPRDESCINIHIDQSVPKRLSEYFKIIYDINDYLNKNFPEYIDLAKERNNELYRTL